MHDMRISCSDSTIEIAACRDRMETILGILLFCFSMFFFWGAPQTYHQEWSYRFGAVSALSRILTACFAVLLGIVCLAGAWFNLFKRALFAIDRRKATVIYGEFLGSRKGLRERPVHDVAGIVQVTKEYQKKVYRFLIVRFRDGQEFALDAGCAPEQELEMFVEKLRGIVAEIHP